MARREFIHDVERAMQAYWAENKIGQAEPAPGKEKYFITFPYPYMNGRLHLGHLYSLTKPEIAARFKKLQGYNVLWPFGLHCTGMPIMSAADKLQNEIEGFEAANDKAETDKDVETVGEKAPLKRMKTKVAQKTGGVKKQSDIMRAMGIPEEEIFGFADPMKWLDYFPEKCIGDLKLIGFSGDLRRSFITTDRNKYYDSFIRWQFMTLKNKGFIGYGMRPTVFSAVDDQPCLDHDRSAGEGATPQEFILIKVKIQSPPAKWTEACGDKNFYMVCATLRPETMYGQTNVFVLPHGDYKMSYAFTDKKRPTDDDVCARIKMSLAEAKDECNDVFVCSDRSLRNMMHQGIIPMNNDGSKQYHDLGDCKGWDLLGMACSAPLTPMKTIYALPMTSISMDKGTGIVTSVPSDSPDDYINARECRTNEEYRKKYYITEEMCNFDIIDIVEIPGYGTQAAVTVSERMKIKNPDDKNKLSEAKAETYTKGFYEGKLIVGEFAGTMVSECKPFVRDVLMKNKEALIYHEPDKKVTSRSGDDCVVSQLNQWYLTYGDESWKKNVRDWIQNGLNCFNEQVKNQFLFVVDWLQDWACTRNYGLGTKCPWEEDQLIESLSDSVVYYAFYTIKHLLHSDLMGDATGELNISPEQLTHEFWDYVLTLSDEYPESAILAGISKEKADRCRDEFNYWYPMNFRSSAKDLVPNHLTMSLFHHEAIWPGQAETRQNQEYFVNGHVLVDNEKMAKSAGNFLTLFDSVNTYTADGVRIACSLAGDTPSDANFERPVAESALLKLYTLIHHVEKCLKDDFETRAADTPYTDLDRMFEAQISQNAKDGFNYFHSMRYREAMRAVYFEMLNTEGRYLFNCSAMGVAPHAGLHRKWMETIAVCLSPVAPHACEYIYRKHLGHVTSVGEASWHVIDVDTADIRRAEIFNALCEDFRKTAEKQKKGKAKDASMKAVIYVRNAYLDWQVKVLEVLEKVCQFDGAEKLIDADAAAVALRSNESIKSLPKQQQGLALAFGIYHLKEEVDRVGKAALDRDIKINEEELIMAFEPVVKNACNVEEIQFVDAAGEDHPMDKTKGKTRGNSRPLKPAIFFTPL